jgi:hypothetical protein
MDFERTYDFPSISLQQDPVEIWQPDSYPLWLKEEDNPSFNRLHHLSNNFDRVEFCLKDFEDEQEAEEKSKFFKFDFLDMSHLEKRKAKRSEASKEGYSAQTDSSGRKVQKEAELLFDGKSSDVISTKAPSERGDSSDSRSVVSLAESIPVRTSYSHKTLEDLNSFIEKAKKLKLKQEMMSCQKSVRSKHSRIKKAIHKKSSKTKRSKVLKKNRFSHVDRLLKRVYKSVKKSQKLSFIAGSTMASVLLLHEKTNKLIQE